MVSPSSIRSHMAVFASDGSEVGKVDDVADEHFKLTRRDSPDGRHHLVPLGWVSRVDGNAVHLSRAPGEVLALGTGAAAGSGASTATKIPLPSVTNPAIGDGVRRGNYYLPWILLALGLLVLLLLLTRSCAGEPVAETPPPAAAR